MVARVAGIALPQLLETFGREFARVAQIVKVQRDTTLCNASGV